MRQEGEPSVEEILESIKKVIARDNRESAAAERQRRENTGLRGRYVDTAPVEPDIDDDDSDRGVLELGAAEIIDDASAPQAPASVAPVSPLLGTEAERSMRDSLAELEALSESSATRTAGGTSIEGLVREMLKPMLAQWLDQHMPAIVERLVKAEIARLRG